VLRRRFTVLPFTFAVHWKYDQDGAVAASYRVDALPVTFVISPAGWIVARHPGALTVPELAAILDMDFPSLPEVGS